MVGMTGRWRRLAGGLAVVMLAVGAACGGGDDGPAEGTGGGQKQYSVKVATLRQPHLFHPDFYARFLPANVKIEVVPFANSTEIKNAVVTGAVDFGVTGLTSAIQGAADDEPIRVVASAADGGSAIVARADRNIRQVTDLKGRKVGYVPGSAQDVLLRLTLRDAGLDADKDVQLIKLGFTDMATALERGDIDAFSSAETGPSDALVKGARLVVHPYGTKMGRINIVFITSKAVIERDRELVQTMVGVHAKATDYMKGHATEWADAVVKRYGFPAESLALAIKNIFLRWEMDDAYVAQARVLGEQEELLKQIRRQPDYASFFDLSFVRAVRKAS